MRACVRCGHDNADHLVYCFSCGRRLDAGARVTLRPGDAAGWPPRDDAGVDANGAGHPSNPTNPANPTNATLAGFAATVALTNVGNSISADTAPPSGATAGSHDGLHGRALDSLRYLFAYVRGRIDAEEQRRRLGDEREGARRLLEGALAELGHAIRSQPTPETQHAGLVDVIARAEARRGSAVTDLAAAQQFQAADDLRLGAEQSAAETEWNACDLGAAEIDQSLRRIDDERREIDVDIARLDADSKTADARERTAARAALIEKRTDLNERYSSLRARAAALRASTLATRTKLDQAISARRQAVVAMAASLAAHARARNEAEAQIRDLLIQLGREATRVRLSLPALAAIYGRVDRLEQIIAERDRQLTALATRMGRYDLRKLMAGVALLSAILAALGASLWALLR